MRIRLGYADGTQDILIGEIESTAVGLKLHGRRRVWMRNLLDDYRRVLLDELSRHAYLGLSEDDLAPERIEGPGGIWLRLTDEQVLQHVRYALSRSWHYWCNEVPSTSADTDTESENRMRSFSIGRGQRSCVGCGRFLPLQWVGEGCQACQDSGRVPRPSPVLRRTTTPT